MKRLITGMAAALLAAILFIPVGAISAEKAIVVDGLTGRVLYERLPNERSLIASTTKIMTALVVCEQCNVLDRMAIPKAAVGVEGSSIYLQEGEILTIQELLYGMMLHSGNDAATALAIYCGGTVEGFAQLMNDKAHRLGMENTHFVNPHGLDAPDHFSTAEDLAVLAVHAMKNPVFCRTVSAKTVKIGDRYLRNHNKLLWSLEGADGVKTGFTKAAGRILVSSACRQGRRIVAVTINAPNDWKDHSLLMEEGFSRYRVENLVARGECLGTVEVAGGTDGFVELLAAEDYSFALAEGETWELVLPDPGFVYAPVARGQLAGYGHICINGEAVGKIALEYGDTVEVEQEISQPWWKRLLGGII